MLLKDLDLDPGPHSRGVGLSESLSGLSTLYSESWSSLALRYQFQRFQEKFLSNSKGFQRLKYINYINNIDQGFYKLLENPRI